jgi:glycosyltransferase involved in cell wall biosynthesis
LISIIIPIRNEVKSIKRIIDSILYQNDMDQQIEILIAEGMSHDGTREIIEGYLQINENIHLVDNFNMSGHKIINIKTSKILINSWSEEFCSSGE